MADGGKPTAAGGGVLADSQSVGYEGGGEEEGNTERDGARVGVHGVILWDYQRRKRESKIKESRKTDGHIPVPYV